MSWQLYDAGPAKDVAERLLALSDQGQGEKDIAQFRAMRDTAVAELSTLSADTQVKVDCQGENSDKRFSINFHVYSRQL